MPWFYADSSVLVKRHLPELGSTWFRALTAPRSRNRIATAQLSLVEVMSAFNRRVREQALSATEYETVRDDFLARYQRTYQIVPITDPLLKRTRLLLEQHPLRSYDALHLAAALAVRERLLAIGQPLVFLAADTRLLAAATSEGFTVENPNNHP